MIGKTTFEVDANVMDPQMQTELMIQRCVLPAMRKAINVIAVQARQNLEPHQSDRTGTRDKMSKKTRTYHEQIREHLIDEVQTRVSYDRRKHIATGTLFFDKGSAWVANFLEYGHPLMRWGDKQYHLIDKTLTLKKTFKFDKTFNIPLGKRAWGFRIRRRIRKQRTFKKDVTIQLFGQEVTPYPFLRPAYGSKRDAAIRLFYHELKKCFKKTRRQPIKKAVIIGTVGAITAASAYGIYRRGTPGNRPSGEPIILPFPGSGTVTPSRIPAARRSDIYHVIAA